jgi:chemotaxis protein methyltransferase CheR
MSAALRAAAPADAAFDLTDADFRMIAEIAHRSAGIVVREHKKAMIRGRLMRRVRDLGLPSVSAYCQLLRGPELESEMNGLLNALTTNHTAFWREAHHFEHMEATALPDLAPCGLASAARFRIWCAAASSGEEPYTIAATVNAALRGAAFRDLRILATDIDSQVLDRARAAVYPATALEGLPAEARKRLELEPAAGGSFRIGQRLRELVALRRLNIIGEWPFGGPFQIIFCRNMLIYFDQPTKHSIIERMSAMLVPGGYLYLGHSEALPHAIEGLRPCGRTIYRKG